MSPWRDWVIRAFNDNLPYDQFVQWQVAGDLLQAPRETSFSRRRSNRLHRQTNEGKHRRGVSHGIRCDRVHTFGTAFLGLTLECSRCHDHKYDPIRQTDYYKLSAFFNNIDESGVFPLHRATPTPTCCCIPKG